ncbi:MAG: adenosine kinase [Alphaproteobacteria bacterium]
MTLDVLAIGNAIVDVLAHAPEVFLDQHGLVKGSMRLISDDMAEKLYQEMGNAVESSGGSAGNTVAAMASLGAKTAFAGRVGKDSLGKIFSHDLQSIGVESYLEQAENGESSARCLTLITPDAERTMCTFLGAARDFSGAALSAELLGRASVVYLEGYLFDQPKAKAAMLAAAAEARLLGRSVALTLSDVFCVERHHEYFLHLIRNHANLLFCNAAEATTLLGLDFWSEDGAKTFQQWGITACITEGAAGALIVTPEQLLRIPVAPNIKPVDLTGAGDVFAAGFLYGYTKGWGLDEAAWLGCRMAGQIIQQFGARSNRPYTEILREKPPIL